MVNWFVEQVETIPETDFSKGKVNVTAARAPDRILPGRGSDLKTEHWVLSSMFPPRLPFFARKYLIFGPKAGPGVAPFIAMHVEESAIGRERRLQVSGIGRFLGVPFLSVWLVGWAIGEFFALAVLVKGGWSVLTGHAQAGAGVPLAVGAVFAGLFLLVWLSLWTLGGIAAGHELLRLLFGRDVILSRQDELQIQHHYGLFRSVKNVRRDEIRRVYRPSPGGPVCVDTTRGTIELTRLGTAAEREELEQSLNTEFGLDAQASAIGALPKGWCEVSSVEHDALLVKDPAVRRKQARTAWIMCAVLSSVPLYLLLLDRQRPDLLTAVLVFAGLASLAGWGAVWLSFGRNEWRLEKGRLILQRRFGQNRTPRFEAGSLELAENHSGEDGPSYVLTAVATGVPPGTNPATTWKHRRTIHSHSSDPTEPRNLGLWISQRCQIPFTDLTTAQAKAIELEELKQKLAGSGAFGRTVVRIIERVAPSRPRSRSKG